MSNTVVIPSEMSPAELAPYDPNQRMGRTLRRSFIVMALLVGVGGLAGALIPIGGAVIGSGQLGIADQVKRVAHPTGGTIAEILVRNGQHVRKGQVLVRLDDKIATADAAMSSLSVDQMIAQKARLEAERLGASSITFPESLRQRADSEARKSIADEQRMFELRRSEERGMRAQLISRVGQYERQINGYQAQIVALRRQGALIEPERKGIQELYAKRLVTLNRLNQLERTAVDLEGSIGSLNAQIAATHAHIAETREQAIQLGETRRTEAGAQLAQINLQLNQQQVRSASAIDQRDRTVVRAPCDGVVEQISVATIGGVIRPAEPILAVVPDKGGLIVEAALSPADIDQVHLNQTARVRFSSLNNTTSPELHGRVVYVGIDPVSDGEGASRRTYFPVRVAIDRGDRAANREMVLKPGMPAELFIETGNRSMLSFLTKPFQDQFARAFRN